MHGTHLCPYHRMEPTEIAWPSPLGHIQLTRKGGVWCFRSAKGWVLVFSRCERVGFGVSCVRKGGGWCFLGAEGWGLVFHRCEKVGFGVSCCETRLGSSASTPFSAMRNVSISPSVSASICMLFAASCRSSANLTLPLERKTSPAGVASVSTETTPATGSMFALSTEATPSHAVGAQHSLCTFNLGS